jgi:hypothetical protein
MCIQIMMPVGEGVDMGGHSGILEFKVSWPRLDFVQGKADASDERTGGRPIDGLGGKRVSSPWMASQGKR